MDPATTAVISATAPVVATELLKDSANTSDTKLNKWIKIAAIGVSLYIVYHYMIAKRQK